MVAEIEIGTEVDTLEVCTEVCVHHWIVPTPDPNYAIGDPDPVSKCKNCGTERVFDGGWGPLANSAEYSWRKKATLAKKAAMSSSGKRKEYHPFSRDFDRMYEDGVNYGKDIW